MNPENRDFPNFEEEIASKAENKEKEEQINLSFASAADLVKQIEEKGYFDRNEYQDTCKYVVIHNKNTGKNDVWDFEYEEELDFDDKHLTFYHQLPTYFKQANDKNMRVFFCRSKYDIPLMRISVEIAPLQKIKGVPDENLRRWLTPDGIQYQYIHAAKGGMETILYSEEPLPIDEVKKIAVLVKEKDNFTKAKKLPLTS